MTENEIMAIREKRLAEVRTRIVREEAELLGRDRTTREVSFMLGIQEPALCRWAINGVVTGTYKNGLCRYWPPESVDQARIYAAETASRRGVNIGVKRGTR